MPGGDRTGPRGEGPMTGRGAGYCTGSLYPGFTQTSTRMGLAYGRGNMQMPVYGNTYYGGGFLRRGMGLGRGRGCRGGRSFRRWVRF
jgi:hypothetical protein